MNLVLGAAGAFIGSFFGPLGASIGWAIGSAIGSSIGQKGTEGPRLTDLKIQTSAYGSPISLLYGTIRVAGASVIWQTDLIEHPHTTSGKGGGRQTATTYSYSASFAVMLCQTSFIDGSGALVNNPILGIKRIWADKRLIWNEGVRVGGTVEIPITIYYGTDTQNPDPTMEANLGAGNVPAHRGFAYLVFTDWGLSEFFNRIPNLEFEIHASGQLILQQYANWDVDWNLHGDHSVYSYQFSLNGQELDSTGKILTSHQWRSNEDYGGTRGLLTYNRHINTLQGGLLDTTSATIFVGAPSGTPSVSSPIQAIGSLNSFHMYHGEQFTTSCVVCNGSIVVRFLSTSAWIPAAPNVGYPLCVLCATTNGLSLGINGNLFFHKGYLYATGGGLTDDPNFGGPGTWVRRWPCDADGNVAQMAPDASFTVGTIFPTVGPYGRVDPGYGCEVTVGDDGFVYVMVSASLDVKNLLFKLTRDLQFVHVWDPLPLTYTPGHRGFTVFQNHLLVQANNSTLGGYTPNVLYPGIFLYRFNDDFSFTLIDYLFGSNTVPDGIPSATIPLGRGFVAWRGGILNLGGETTYADIVTNISLRCGLALSDIDVTDIPEVCHGFAVGQQMTGRAAIEALMPADLFDATESDLKAKFVKRGLHPTVGQIPDIDLGAVPKNAQPIPLLEPLRKDESQLPRRIYLKYFSIDADYEDGTQIFQRVVTTSELDVTINLPVAMHDSEAKYIVDVLGASAWAERNTFKFSTPLKWAYLDPTDTASPRQFAMRITQQSIEDQVVKYDAAGVIESVYIQQNTAPAPQIVPQPPTPSGGQYSDALLMDLPLVKDSDNPNGWYAAMAGRAAAASWPGAELERSVDGGVTYSALLTSSTPNTFGYTTTILPNWRGGNFFDESSTVDVVIGNGSGDTLSGATELAVYNGVNLCVIGFELVQFKNAVLIAANKYRLSGLLRGCRGTEWAKGTHFGGERFCMLPVINVNGPFDELSVSMLYKAVTSGAPLSSATAVTFSNEGEALRPYAPCHLGGGRNAAGDILIRATRRTRIGGAWKNFVDVPLSEVVESYQLNFYTNSTYAVSPYSVNILTLAYTFTVANQVAFMGGLQNPLYFGISQDGSYQTGHEARGVV